MKKTTLNNDDEINLVELIYLFWDGKFKIFLAIAISVALMSLYVYLQNSKKNFISITEINPITSLEENKYSAFNNKSILMEEKKFNINFDINEYNKNNGTDFSKIIEKERFITNEIINQTSINFNRLDFYNQFIELLNEKKIFEDAIRKYNLIDSVKYKDDELYNNAIKKLASSIKIKNKGSNQDSKSVFEYPKFTIEFKFNDVQKWKDALVYADKTANQILGQELRGQVETFLKIKKEQMNYTIEDLSIRILNVKRDYELEIIDRITFLEEQSQIAKTLGISKNTTIETNQNKQNNILVPFYLRGYEAIDKEIEKIKKRENKDAFISGLRDLESAKRTVEQDRSLERLKVIFLGTPLANNEDFFAGKINIVSTTFDFDTLNYNKMLILSIFIGFIFGAIYLIIVNSFQSYNLVRKKIK